jgi:hypothetical protein
MAVKRSSGPRAREVVRLVALARRPGLEPGAGHDRKTRVAREVRVGPRPLAQGELRSAPRRHAAGVTALIAETGRRWSQIHVVTVALGCGAG